MVTTYCHFSLGLTKLFLLFLFSLLFKYKALTSLSNSAKYQINFKSMHTINSLLWLFSLMPNLLSNILAQLDTLLADLFIYLKSIKMLLFQYLHFRLISFLSLFCNFLDFDSILHGFLFELRKRQLRRPIKLTLFDKI